jgi:spore coat polysaccharide biosynthesis protein SpsF (cytidylyltransferase family)
MNPSRHPAKPLADIAGKPLLVRCFERLAAARSLGGMAWQLSVATSKNPADDPIAELAAAHGYRCFRGPEDDVLARLLTATADLAPHDVLVRATANHPLVCPQRTVRLVTEFLQSKGDYRGVDPLSSVVPEAIRVAALRAAATAEDLQDVERMDVTPYFRRPKLSLRVRSLPPNWAGIDPELRLAVDTEADIAAMNRLYRELISLAGDDRPGNWTLEQVYGVVASLGEPDRAFPSRKTVPNREAGCDVGPLDEWDPTLAV